MTRPQEPSQGAPSHPPQAVCPVCPYGLTSRCEGVDEEFPASWETQRVIGCLDPRRQVSYYRDLHEENLDADTPAPSLPRHLPAFIPVLVRVLPESVRLPELPMYGVGYTTVLRNTGAVRYVRGARLRQQLGLPPDASVCLLGTATDARLENAWTTSETQGLWRRLADLSFTFVTTTTFSVWDRQPRFDQIYNQERNLYSYLRFTRLGIPTVPFLFYRTAADLRSHVEWLRRHQEVDIVAVLAQFYRQTEDFRRLMQGMQNLVDLVDRKLRFLVTGCASAAKIELLFSQFPTASVASTKPVMQALHGRKTTPTLEHERVSRREDTKVELLANNVSRFAAFCNEARPLSELPA